MFLPQALPRWNAWICRLRDQIVEAGAGLRELRYLPLNTHLDPARQRWRPARQRWLPYQQA